MLTVGDLDMFWVLMNEKKFRAVFVWWAHRHVPTQYFEIYVAVHPISDVPLNCVPTQYLATRYGTA